MRRVAKAKAAGGFTLIEVLIALVILSVGMTALIPVLLHTVKGNSFGKTSTATATWSQDKLEELRVQPFTDLAIGTYTDSPPSPPLTLTRQWRIADGCGGCGDVLVVEVCTAESTKFGATCFSAAPVASHHFMATRARF